MSSTDDISFSLLQMSLIFIIVIVIILMITVVNVRYAENKLLKGFWKASNSFCQEADIELMLLYIGDEISIYPYKLTGYLLMKNADGILINNPLELILDDGYDISLGIANCRKWKININWISEDDFDFFPCKQELHYYPSVGKLEFNSRDKVYAVLYKDNFLSDKTDNNQSNQELDTEKHMLDNE